MGIRSPWLEKFQPGSFRGVPFIIQSHNFTGGRRTQDHEFPERDINRVEDLGRKLRKFSIEMLVFGDDYFEQRNALQDALEQKGSGELIHPYLGKFRAQVDTFSINETTTEGRMARISVSFSEAGVVKFPEAVDDEAQKVETSADSVIDKSKTTFEQIFSVANQPAHVVQDAADKVSSLTDFMETSVAKFTNTVADLAFSIRNLRADVDDLIQAPGILASRISETFALLNSSFSDDPKTASKVLGNLDLFGNDFDPIVGLTPSNQKQQSNEDGLVNFSRQLAFSNRGKSAINSDFDSIDEAIIERDEITESIDRQLGNVLDDDLFQAMKDLQSSTSKALPSAGLGELITFTPPITLPSLVIVHQLFQDLSKEDELITQNDVRHPGFVPGGIPVEVSSA